MSLLTNCKLAKDILQKWLKFETTLIVSAGVSLIIPEKHYRSIVK